MLSAAKAVLQVRALAQHFVQAGCFLLRAHLPGSMPAALQLGAPGAMHWAPCAGQQRALDWLALASSSRSTPTLSDMPSSPRQDLNKHQLLPILLTGQPLSSDEQRWQQGLHTLSEEQQERYSQLTRPAVGRRWERGLWRGQPGGAAGGTGQQPGGPAGAGGAALGADGGGASGGMGAGASNSSSSSSSGGSSRRQKQAPTGQDEELEERLSPEHFQRLLQQRGLDCRGWKLVVAAHSLGAAVAALVGMHFRSFAPGGQHIGEGAYSTAL